MSDEPARAVLSPETKLAMLRGARRLSRRLPRTWDRRLRELAKVAVDYRGARASFPRSILYALLRRGSPLLVAPFGRGRLLVDTGDDEIGRVVFITGGYERMYMEAAIGFLTEAGHWRPGRAFVDVGANIGTSTVDALLEFGFGRAFCFEPDIRNLRLLKMNLVLNGLEGLVQVHPVALSDRDGEAVLERSSWNYGDSRLLLEGGERATDVERIRCVQLDTLLADGTVPLDDLGLVWIDAQGHEPFVLRGATAVAAAGVPTVVEYSPAALHAAGGLEPFEELVRTHYTRVVDVRMLCHGLAASASIDGAAIHQLRERYPDDDHTDLLLVP